MLNDEDEIEEFLIEERKLERIWLGLCYSLFFLYLFFVVMIGLKIFDFNRYINAVMLIQELLLIVGLVYSYNSLTRLLKEFHLKRYKEIKSSMGYFFYVELIPLVISCIFFIFTFLRKATDTVPVDEYVYVVIVEVTVMLIYPFIQAYGIIHLKDSKDPISGISNLN